MLDFMWHLRGSVPMDGVATNEAALDRLECLLEKQRKRDRKRGADFLSFDDPIWSDPLGPNWLAMVIYDRGRFWIEQGIGGRQMRYDLRSLHGMVFCLFVASTVFLLVGFGGGGLVRGLKWAVGAFGWLYGMNILLALARVPWAIRSAVRRA